MLGPNLIKSQIPYMRRGGVGLGGEENNNF